MCERVEAARAVVCSVPKSAGLAGTRRKLKATIMGLVLACTVPIASAAVAQDVTLRYAALTGFTYPDLMISHFGPLYEQETGVKIEVEIYSPAAGRDKMLLEAVSGSDYFHFGYMSPGWHGLFAEHLVGLDPFIEKYNFDLDAYPELALQSHGMAGDLRPGEIIAIPHAVVTPIIAYREDWFADPGEKEAFLAEYGRELTPPATWAELYEVATFFTRDPGESVAGKVLTQPLYGWADSRQYLEGLTRSFIALVYSAGLEGYDAETFEPDLDDPVMIELAEYFVKLNTETAPPSAVNWAFTEHVALVNEGHVAVAMFWPNAITVAENPAGEAAGNLAYRVLPAWEGNRKGWTQGSSYMGGGGISIFDTPNAEEAFKFLQWLFETNSDEFIRRTETYARKSHFTDPVTLANNPGLGKMLPALAQQMETASERQKIPEFQAAVWNPIGEFIQDILNEDSTPEEAQAQLVATMRAELERGGYYNR